VGDFKNGKRHGTGRITYQIGGCESYVGEWKWGKPDGEGKETYINKDYYEGFFLTGMNYYEGSFSNGKREGQGTLTKNNKITLHGKWSNGAL
jgi:hypothetical protein